MLKASLARTDSIEGSRTESAAMSENWAKTIADAKDLTGLESLKSALMGYSQTETSHRTYRIDTNILNAPYKL